MGIKSDATGITVTLKKQELVSSPAIGEISHEIAGKELLIDEKEQVIALCERKLGDFLRDFLSKQPNVWPSAVERLPRGTHFGCMLSASAILTTSERRQMNKLKLTYFDFPGGRAEPARLAMHIGGVPFEDYRFSPGDFSEVRKTTPLNQVPTLHVNDLQITQSDAITRYVGKLSGLYPEDDLQALLCDEVMGALEDINVKLGATFGKTGDALKSARDALTTDALPTYLRWLQHQLESRGGEFLADNRLTIADLKAFVILRWLSSGKLDHIPMDLIETVAPKLNNYINRLAKIPAIAQYYEIPPQDLSLLRE